MVRCFWAGRGLGMGWVGGAGWHPPTSDSMGLCTDFLEKDDFPLGKGPFALPC